MAKKDSPSNKRLRAGTAKQDSSTVTKSQLSNQARQHPVEKAMSNAHSESQAKQGPASQKTSRARKRKKAATSDQDGGKATFPIVGIGASAGGLEAFTELLNEIPTDTGMAFVLIQHLDPTHESMLTDLLSRATSMSVTEATDQLTVQPDHIYVIPPDTNLGILHGALQLMPRGEQRKQHLPIDYFMISLSQDRGVQAIGVILSGTASDGALGLKSIKAEGGITMAQDPKTAKYDGMPRSAIAVGSVDFVLPLQGITDELKRIAGHPLVARAEISERQKTPRPTDALNKIFLLLRSHTGNDFTYYKPSTIERRIKRRMLLHKLELLPDYVRLLQHSNAEVGELFQDILINVTSFFRDSEAFEALKPQVLEKIMENRSQEDPIRIWIPGCSTGEEVYTVAMLLVEFLGDRVSSAIIQIFGTDIDTKAIDKARMGIYPEGISGDIAPLRLKRFFVRVPEGYQIAKSIRDLCVFAVQNVTKDPPFSKLDLVCCRNLLIYLGSTLQKKILHVFHYALKPKGFLMLGTSESIGGHAELFALTDRKNKIYTKKILTQPLHYDMVVSPYKPLDSEISRSSSEMRPAADLPRQADRLVLSQYAPPGVIINRAMEILHFRGHTGPYIDPVPGTASLNLLKIARQDLIMELRSVVHRAISEGVNKRKEDVKLRINGEEWSINIHVVPIRDPVSKEDFYLVLFEQPPPALSLAPIPAQKKKSSALSADEKDQRINELEQEILTLQEYMQSTIEEQEATNEELNSANEETQSANEELQSTNEELETAKEELQSTNEELATVNEELENRNHELTHVNNDLTNLLSNINLAIIVLDENLCIRHFTRQAQRLLNLIGTDIGRPITDIKPNFEVPDLGRLVQEIIETMITRSADVEDGEGHFYKMIARPYRTSDNRISGAVLTFIEVTDRKRREELQRLAAVVRDSNDAIMEQDFKGHILAWNPSAEQIYGYTEREALSMNIGEIIPEEQRNAAREFVKQLSNNKSVLPFETKRITKDGCHIRIWITASLLLNEDGKPRAIATTEHQVD